jgi:maleate isomerase
VYAWRARIGFISPTHRGKVFAFWYQNAPDGVEIIPTYIGFRQSTPETFRAGIQRAEELAEQLAGYGCTAIVVSGSPPFLLEGPVFEQEWGEALSKRLGIPVITPMAPHIVASKAQGITSVAIASYYGTELVDAIVRYFDHFGIDAQAFPGYSRPGAEPSALYSTSLSDLDAVDRYEVYRYCKQGFAELARPVDAIYINGGGWDAAPAVDLLERDLRMPVVFALAAEMWRTYRVLQIEAGITDCGALLRGDTSTAQIRTAAAGRGDRAGQSWPQGRGEGMTQ